MSEKLKYKFINGVYFIPCLGVIKSDSSTQKLNLSEQYILQYLIDNANQPASKSDLLQAGWPERVVSEASLFQAIRGLRVKLQEINKGDVIETLPRVGYQITQFSSEAFSDKAPFTLTLIKQQYIPHLIISLIGLTTFILIGLSWHYGYKYPSQAEYQIRITETPKNTVTLIGSNKADLDDLTDKLFNIYKLREENPARKPIENLKIFAYKGNNHYSLSWCKVNDSQQCKPYTDHSYLISHDDWSTFEKFTIDGLDKTRTDPIVQTDLARDPTSQVYLKFVDDSGIDSQVVYQYISKDENNDLTYSYLTFISEKETEYHYALSISSAIVTIVNNASPFLATAELKPEMYHWAYQNNDVITESKSTSLQVEESVQNKFKSKTISYSYLLYQQPYLDLVLNDEVGLFWVHNSERDTKKFNYKRYSVDQESR
ncbi:winged helix-turn-helix domain-containing protein [Photobacterium makurazakiensis]|uniref:winged helix-turn-helix domain-containing protein n=1 Tax=Photobacterium makurazakiensis TaxID=2910234 RepID=UPI003D11E8CB